jgi:hypothetical protein
MVMDIKITVLWDLKPCSLVDKYHHLEETAASIFGIEEIHTSSTSETMISTCQTTKWHIPQDGYLNATHFLKLLHWIELVSFILKFVYVHHC